MIRASRSTIAILGSAALAVGSIAAAGASVAAPSQHTLAGSRPAWAKASHRVRSTPGSQTVDFKMYLPWRHEAAAERYALDASTSGNARSGKFLTPAQFRSRYAPTGGQVSSVKSWLRTQGFDVTSVPSNNRYVEARGDVATAAKAFRTSFAQYRVQGIRLRSNTTELTVPSSLGVDAVTGLDQSYGLVHSQASPPAVFKNAAPCSSYWGEKTVQNTKTPDNTKLPDSPSAFAPCGYAGKQLQGVYGLNPGDDGGSGVTVAIVDAYASTTIESDANKYFYKHGLPKFTNGQFKQIVAPGTYNRPENNKQDPEGWSGEETLDVEAVHTAAPGANVLYVGAPNNHSDLDAALNKVVNGHLADVVSNSYGYAGEALPKGYIKPFEDTLVQAAATGISVFFSSGDSADETGGVAGATPSPDWPASSPLVTAVGGTSLGIDQDNTRKFELGWETTKSTLDQDGSWSKPAFQYGSGGGTSRMFAQPDYQQGVVPTSLSEKNGSSQPMRVVPDVSAIGDPNTGMLIGQTQRFPDGHSEYSEYRIGGTSLASPLYAGMFALAVQKHGEYGLANPALYSTAGQPETYDVTKTDRSTYPGDVRVDYVNGVDASNGYTYSARWFDQDENLSIHVGDGYDDVTGIGSPNGPAWLTAVAAYH